MGSIQLELGLSSKQTCIPKSTVNFLNDLKNLDYCVPEKLSKLEAYLQKHKEEFLRLEPFQQVFPVCVELLKDSIEILQDEIMLLGESMPTKDLMNSLAFQANDSKQKQPVVAEYDEPKNHLPSSYYGENIEKEIMEESSITPNAKIPNVEFTNICHYGPNLRVDDYLDHPTPQISEPIMRGNRITWSPELHAKFLEALNANGGPQAARPKQIKEFMKVDGLTNEQIKSHLQKYRLQLRALQTQNPTNMVDHVEFQNMQRQHMFGGTGRDNVIGMPITSPYAFLLPNGQIATENNAVAIATATATAAASLPSHMQIGDEVGSNYCFDNNIRQHDGSQAAFMYRKYI
ncbi:transcription factor HHO5-like [Senna tora]|uniref:Transcription factor HHO5-like n=1 Tax=Senna tora TaxID=362788 RepID=A0A834THL6_9FABA|nr:transcription factor HHO5-like [Senna tora]